MLQDLEEAFVVAATRTPVGKAPRGALRTVRPDDLLVAAIRAAVAQVPSLDPAAIEDAVIGCAFPEGEQGMNVARNAALLAGLPDSVGGITVNRYCSSGLNAIAIAADRIRVGEAHVMLAGGVESMSMVPMAGNKPAFNPHIFDADQNVGIAFGMGITAEKVAQRWKVSREAQDEFALASHQRAIAAQKAGEFGDEITPFEVVEKVPNLGTHELEIKKRSMTLDEGPRADTSAQALAKLKQAFAAQALAVIGDLGLDRAKVNPMGGAIALGHPLGATGAIRSATVVHALRRRGLKYGMVTMCVGTGMGAAGIFERL